MIVWRARVTFLCVFVRVIMSDCNESDDQAIEPPMSNGAMATQLADIHTFLVGLGVDPGLGVMVSLGWAPTLVRFSPGMVARAVRDMPERFQDFLASLQAQSPTVLLSIPEDSRQSLRKVFYGAKMWADRVLASER